MMHGNDQLRTEVTGTRRVARVHRDTPTTVVQEVVDASRARWFVKSVRAAADGDAWLAWSRPTGRRAERALDAC